MHLFEAPQCDALWEMYYCGRADGWEDAQALVWRRAVASLCLPLPEANLNVAQGAADL
jgi:hypothetical protein